MLAFEINLKEIPMATQWMYFVHWVVINGSSTSLTQLSLALFRSSIDAGKVLSTQNSGNCLFEVFRFSFLINIFSLVFILIGCFISSVELVCFVICRLQYSWKIFWRLTSVFTFTGHGIEFYVWLKCKGLIKQFSNTTSWRSDTSTRFLQGRPRSNFIRGDTVTQICIRSNHSPLKS